MEVLHERCAGLDVHKDTVVACVRVATGKKVQRETKTFGTTTDALLNLLDWLQENEVKEVAMEATGVYWKPIWYILEDGMHLTLANPAHIKNVPGRKTDVRDCEWIADLIAHGLISSSFVPPQEIHDLRGLTRARKQISQERTRYVQRIQKTLQDANIKIDSFISDIMGKSGRAFLDAIIAGETDPVKLAALGDRRLRADQPTLVAALKGRIRQHHRFMLRTFLAQIKAADDAMVAIGAEVAALLEPFRPQVDLVVTIPGISEMSAEVILAEIGVDMSRFPTAEQLVSWARLCPRSDESAGKKHSKRVLKGGNTLKKALLQSAWACVRDKKKGGRYRALFARIKGRSDAKRAIVAVAARLLRTVWYVIKHKTPYENLVEAIPDEEAREKQATRLARKLRALGYSVELKQAA